MTEFGYTLMCEQSGPKELVADAVRAEEAGFGFAVISDHYFPWLEEQGHSPYAWSVLGAVTQVAERIGLMTYVTCPIRRYHPPVTAQKAATIQILSDGRFTLGLGAGENLNEHVVGGGWAPVNTRHQHLAEALAIIRALLGGGWVNFQGRHFQVESAKLWDVPARPVPIGVAVSGPQSCRLAGGTADLMTAVEPRPELGRMFDAAGGRGKARVGQLPCTCGPGTWPRPFRVVPTWKASSTPPGPSWLPVHPSGAGPGGRRLPGGVHHLGRQGTPPGPGRVVARHLAYRFAPGR
jgi:G6PDH family F420-dependent oxidoreductase